MQSSGIARLLALVIAAIAWVGIAINMAELWSYYGSPLLALWELVSYFTILTNVLIGVAFALIALRGVPAVSPRILGGITLSIMLVGIIFTFLLSSVVQLSGGAVITNVLHHQLTPILVPLFWLLFVPKGTLRRHDPLLWAIYPTAYLVYALIRGTAEGRFTYFFIDYVANGIQQTVITVIVITLAFLATGWLMVLLDRRLAR